MRLHCAASYEDCRDYFDNMTFDAARFAHDMHTSLTIFSSQRVAATTVATRTTADDAVHVAVGSYDLTLTIEPYVADLRVTAELVPLFDPPPPDDAQCALLEARDWEGYRRTLPDQGHRLEVTVRDRARQVVFASTHVGGDGVVGPPYVVLASNRCYRNGKLFRTYEGRTHGTGGPRRVRFGPHTVVLPTD